MKFDENDYERLRYIYENRIQVLSEWLWQGKPAKEDITRWLSNYNSIDAEREELNSLYQLSFFMSFELREIREMLKSLYRDHFIRPLIQKIKKSGVTGLESIQNELDINKQNTRFLGIGNASESSCLMLYFFRQENQLIKDYFINVSEIFIFDKDGKIIDLVSKEIMHYVFIDDLAGSGTQAKDFFEDNAINEINKINPDAKVYYFTLFSTEDSNCTLKDYDQEIILKSIFELDNTYKVFGDESRYYSKYNTEKQFAENACKRHAGRYSRRYLCGYRDSQLLLRFFYNTPDNTLPSFWSETQDWQSLFTRYDKFYE